MERKYSDSLNAEDIHGVAMETKKARKGKKGGVTAAMASSLVKQKSLVNFTESNATLQTLPISSAAKSAIFSKVKDSELENKSLLLNSVVMNKKQNLTHSKKLKADSNHMEVRIRGTVPIAEGE